MSLEPRHYRDPFDLDAMRSVLRKGRWANNGSYYIHTGDITWWLFYPPIGVDLFEHLYVWDDPRAPGRLLGWVLLGLIGDNTIDLVIQPELRGTLQALDMWKWAEGKLRDLLHAQGEYTIRVMWVLEDDEVMNDFLRLRGFEPHAATVHMVSWLDGPIQADGLPADWQVRACRGLDEVEARAAAQHGAFESGVPMEQYVERFRRFMRSGVYNPEWDKVVVMEDGTIGAFCITWPDPVNRVGLFEPVGTHPVYQRQGLGRAVMLESLRGLREMGMRQAIVTTSVDNEPAIKLYESVGFKVVNRLITFQKEVS